VTEVTEEAWRIAKDLFTPKELDPKRFAFKICRQDNNFCSYRDRRKIIILHTKCSGKKMVLDLLVFWHSDMPFRSKRQQRLFFATMPELAKEWADKTDFSKLPEKVRKKSKKKKDKSDCGEKALQLATKFEKHVKASVLPDGSGFVIESYPLPKDHWIYSDVELPLTNQDPVEKQREAAKYAIRSATRNGTITDFDPDAMVQNFLMAMK